MIRPAWGTSYRVFSILRPEVASHKVSNWVAVSSISSSDRTSPLPSLTVSKYFCPFLLSLTSLPSAPTTT